jgi:hypothetical protein
MDDLLRVASKKRIKIASQLYGRAVECKSSHAGKYW